jgi:hypothetical protein
MGGERCSLRTSAHAAIELIDRGAATVWILRAPAGQRVEGIVTG